MMKHPFSLAVVLLLVSSVQVCQANSDLHQSANENAKQVKTTKKAPSEDELIVRSADRLGITKTSDFRNAYRSAKVEICKIRIEEHFRKAALKANPELKAEAERLAATPQPGYLFRSIAVTSEESAMDIWQRLKHGEPFGKLSREFSQEQWSEDGGPLGWGTKLDLSPKMLAVLANAPLNDILKPVEVDGRWVIVQLLDARELPPPPKSIAIHSVTDAAVSNEMAKHFPTLYK